MESVRYTVKREVSRLIAWTLLLLVLILYPLLLGAVGLLALVFSVKGSGRVVDHRITNGKPGA